MRVVPPGGREDQNWIAMTNPILAKQFQSPHRQRDIPILSAFPLPEVNHPARAIDILNLKMSSFQEPQTTGINRREASPITLQPDEAENPTNLLRAQDDRKLLFASRANKVENGEVSLESVLEEKLDTAKSNGDAAAGVFLDILEIEEILSKLFLRDQIWGFVKVLRELSNGLDVAFLGTFRKAPELKSLDHLLSKFSHSYTS